MTEGPSAHLRTGDAMYDVNGVSPGAFRHQVERQLPGREVATGSDISLTAQSGKDPLPSKDGAAGCGDVAQGCAGYQPIPLYRG